MKVTARTWQILFVRRVRRALAAGGYEQVSEGGGKLWELYRGYRYDHIITHAIVDPGGKSVWVKIEPTLQKVAA